MSLLFSLYSPMEFDLNIDRRVVNFIFYCFIFKSDRKSGGCETYKRDAEYISIMSPLIEKRERAVHDLIYRYLIYKRRFPISSSYSSQFKLDFEDVCHYRLVSGNMIFQLVPKNKVNSAFRLECAHFDLERLDCIIHDWFLISIEQIESAVEIYKQTLSIEDVKVFISTILFYFSRVLENKCYTVQGVFEKTPSMDTLSVVFINLMKISESDKSHMALRSNVVAELFFSLCEKNLLLSQDNKRVEGMLQVFIDSIIISASIDETSRLARKNAIMAIILGAKQLALTVIDERLSNKLKNLVYSDEHTIERLSKTVFSSIKSCWWFSELLVSAKDKQEKVVYLKAILNSFFMTYQQIDNLLNRIKSANSTKKNKEQKIVEQLTFDVSSLVKERFEKLYLEKRKSNNKLTKRKLISDLIDEEYRKTFNKSERNNECFGITYDEENDLYSPALEVDANLKAKNTSKPQSEKR